MDKSQSNNANVWFYSLLICHSLAWTLAAILCQHDAPLDVMEALVWGREWLFGYAREPFLAPWLAYAASLLGGGFVWPVYALSQTCILLSFFAVWKLALKMKLTTTYALISVILLEGIAYYNFTTPEFNDNLLQLPFWAFTIYYFYIALTEQKGAAWCAVGICAAGALMSKYFAVMLFVPMLFMLFLTVENRKSFKNPFFYLGGAIFACLILPNIIWLIKNNFLYIEYALSRTGDIPHWYAHLLLPLQFMIDQAAILAPMILILLPLFWAKEKNKAFIHSSFNKTFLITLGLGPFATALLYSGITGSHLHTMWGMPLFNYIGLLILFFHHPQINARIFRQVLIIGSIVFCLFLVAYFLSTLGKPYLLHDGNTATFPGQKMAKQLTDEWHHRFNAPLRYVSGSHEHSARMAFYSKDLPKPYFEFDLKQNPWIDERKIADDGMLILWDVNEESDLWVAPLIKERFPNAQIQKIHYFQFQTRASIKPAVIAVAFIAPTC